MWRISRRRQPARPPRRGTEGGFTVIEALVAFAILAGVLGAAYGIYADGLRRTARVAGIAEATAEAENLLARLGVELPLEDAAGRTASGGRWRIAVAPFDPDRPLPQTDTAPLIPYRVTVIVSPPGGGEVRLVSVRLGRVR
ncbi:MAG: hypothetical protein WD767_10750 [Alphaproteobacteria bacterium]